MVKKVLDMDIREYSQDDFLKNLSYDNPIIILDLMNHKADFQDTYFIQTKEASKIKSLEETLITNQSHGYGNGKIGNLASYMAQRAVFLSIILLMGYFVFDGFRKNYDKASKKEKYNFFITSLFPIKQILVIFNFEMYRFWEI